MLNHLIPVVGMGATICIGSDRYPAEIVRVSESGKTCWIRYMNYFISSGSTQDGSAKYEFVSDVKVDYEIKVRKTAKGWIKQGGVNVWFGTQERYYNLHFQQLNFKVIRSKLRESKFRKQLIEEIKMCSKTQGYYQNSKDVELVKRSDGWYFMVAGYTSPNGYQTIIEAKNQADVWVLFNDT